MNDRIKRPRETMTETVQQALDDAELMADYLARPDYQRNDYLLWIRTAKQPETKQKRLQQMLNELRIGGVYMGMSHPASKKN